MILNNNNPFSWVEIYVNNIQRAQKFYETVFQFEMTYKITSEKSENMILLHFPKIDNERNISGALVKTDLIKPSFGGTIVYFLCDDCAIEESRVEIAGGNVIKSKTLMGDLGFCSLIKDTEGNLIGLFSKV